MTRSGWCGIGFPLNHVNHSRCAFDGCPCDCHAAAELTATGPEPAATKAPGLYDDIDEAAYHADPLSLSHSGAKAILRAPALFRHEQQNPVFKKVFDFGSAAHSKVLGIGIEVRVIPEDILASNGATSTKEAKAFIAKARTEGAVALKATETAVIEQMADKLSEHSLAMELLSDGRAEVSAYAEDPETGVMLRGRFDWLGTTIGTDYKSAASADPNWFRRKASEFRYHQQHAWYFDLAAAAGHPLEAFCFIVQMKEPPFLVTVVELVERAVQRGRDLNRRAIDTYARCATTDTWPGYVPDDRFASVDIPEWAYSDFSNDLTDDMEISA